MNRITRVLNAFLTAARMTLRGQKPATADLTAWMAQSARQIDVVLAVAEANGLDRPARRAITLVAEGRRTNMDTILATVRFHAAEEYPHLLAHARTDPYAAIYGTNMNDHFLISRLAEALDLVAVRQAVEAVREHLENMPPAEA